MGSQRWSGVGRIWKIFPLPFSNDVALQTYFPPGRLYPKNPVYNFLRSRKRALRRLFRTYWRRRALWQRDCQIHCTMNKFIRPGLKETIAVQKSDVERLKNEINSTDKKGESTYIKEFLKEYRSYAQISTYDNLYRRCKTADIIWVGDYHANPASQHFLIRLLKALRRSEKPMILGMEMAYKKNQGILEQWLDGRVSEKEFLKRIRYDLEWGYDWEDYRAIFLTAKSLRIAVKGLDCGLRKDLRKIRKRDLCVATNIIEIIQRNSQAQLFIFFGESHLAESHLPGKVRRALNDLGQTLEEVVIVQNMDSIYWDLMRENHRAEVVQIEPGKFCVFNSTPLEKYRSYEQAILRWRHQDEDHPEA